MGGVAAARRAGQEEEKLEATNPNIPAMMVTFPDAGRRRIESFPSPLKLESEQANEGTSPRNAWQVYAFGGLMVATWVWARWKERKNRGIPNED